MIIIRIYQRMISVMLPQSCRFYPSCSNYALEALQRKPLHISIWLILKRLSKCHPFHPGGFDPVP